MTRLAIAAGPPVALPLAFLGAVPAWGLAAGLLLAVDGPAALASRWGPSTLALVHATTLGVLGNAMAGALLQFLPAAAATRVRGSTRAGVAVFLALQGGTLALVAGFRGMAPAWLTAGALLAAAAFALLGACVLPGLLAGREALHRGIALAVVALLAATTLGAAMALALAGHVPGPAPRPWADVHALWALLGGVLVLLAAVGQVVLPMFQGVAARPEAGLRRWRMAVVALLPGAAVALVLGQERVVALAAAACGAAWALSLLARQARAGRRRAGALRLAWAGGALATLAACVALAAGAPAPLTGALVLALALPLPVLAMLLEIVAFLAWIDLQRRAPRGRRVPAVQVLLPPGRRALALAMLALAGVAVVLATREPALASAAGLLLATAHAALLAALLTTARRHRRALEGFASA